MILAVASLWHREVRSFLRQRSRVASALGTPLVLWILLGSGMGESFRPAGAPDDSAYLDFFFPGAAALLLVFNSIFSAISLIQDRDGGFLQGVLVAPVGRHAIVLGKVLGGASLALGQVLVLLVLAPALGIQVSGGGLLYFAAGAASLALTLTALGVVIAWRMDTVQGFHAVMNLLLMPLWMLSGAVFPVAGAAAWVQSVMWINPVTYGVASMRHAFPAATVSGGPDPLTGLCVSAAAAFAMLVTCLWTAGRRE